jgi:hypothetical protein
MIMMFGRFEALAWRVASADFMKTSGTIINKAVMDDLIKAASYFIFPSFFKGKQKSKKDKKNKK